MAMALDSYPAGGLLIAGSVVASVLGLLMVRRFVDSRTLSACHEVGSSLLSVIGTLYSVILGLIVVDAMAKFQEAHRVTGGEANALSDLAMLAGRLPPAKRDQIRDRIAEYADVVVDEEWPLMSRGEFSPKARRAALALIAAVQDFEPVTEGQKTIYAAAVATGSELWNDRRLRISSVTRGMTFLEWAVLLMGGMITIAFTYFFALDRVRVQVAMTVLVALIISLNIYMVAMFGYPYSGDLKVDPMIFDAAREIMEATP